MSVSQEFAAVLFYAGEGNEKKFLQEPGLSQGMFWFKIWEKAA